MKISYQSVKKYGLFSFIFLLNLIIHDAKLLTCWQLSSNILTANQTRIELVLDHKFSNLHEFIFNKYFSTSSTCPNSDHQYSTHNFSFFNRCSKLATVKFLKTRPVIATSKRIGLIHKYFILHQSSNDDPHLFC